MAESQEGFLSPQTVLAELKKNGVTHVLWLPDSETKPREWSQSWHRDPEADRLMKVFLFLEDVTDDAGPLEFVAGSHNGGDRDLCPLRLYPSADIDQLIEDVAAGEDDIGEFRPVHFRDVRAMRFAGAVSGWSNNPMTLLDGHGTYFEDFIIWPAVGNAAPGSILTAGAG